MPTKNYSDFVVRYSLTLNDFFQKALAARVQNPELREILSYSVLAGGKRIRPLLFLATLHELGQEITDEHIKVAGGIELIHTYSLVHDDLPAMDNDDYRRGQLTSHKKFGEAQAILSGDALLTLGINWIAMAKLDASAIQQVIQIMTETSGVNGMIEGQYLDIVSTHQELSLAEIKVMEEKKTAELIIGAVKSACVLGQATDAQTENLVSFAEKFGQAFQIYDDLVDSLETSAEAGKETSKDEERGKNNYANTQGIASAQSDLTELIELMKQDLAAFDAGVLPEFANVFKKVLVND